MKSYKDIVQQLDEVLTKSTPAGTWIKDFVDSDNPKFAGKSPAKRKQMALAAYYSKQKEQANESAAASQNSTAETQMNEDHLVHVNDGSKYDEQPHEKDVEHVMHGVKKHGGENAGLTDKGVLFKFKNHSDAHNFISHVNKCPHRSCDAHMTESVDYDKPTYLRNNPKEPTKKSSWTGFNTDEPAYKRKEQAELEKKRLNKEEVEQIDELSKSTLGSYATKAHNQTVQHASNRAFKQGRGDKDAHDFASEYERKDNNRNKGIATAIKKLAKEETIAEDVDKEAIRKQYKKNESDNRHTENAELLAKHFGSKRDQNQVAKAKAYRDKHNGYGGDILGRHHSNLAYEIHKKLYDKLHEEVEQIDELSKDTLASYAKKASHDARIKQHVAADFKSKEAHARNPRKKETWGSIAKKYQSQAWKREKGHDKAVDKLKEDLELIAKHEVKADAPHKTSGHVILTKSSDKWHVLHNKKSSPAVKDLHSSKLLHSYDNEKEARAKFKELHEEQIDEISKSTLARYIPSAARDVGSHTYSGKESGEWANHYTRAGDWAAAEKHSKKSYADFKKANKRIAGIDKATKKLATQKEEVQVDEATHQVYDTKTHKVHSTHDTYKKAVNAMNKLNKEHPGYDTPGGLEQGKFGAKTVNEASQGDKEHAAFVKTMASHRLKQAEKSGKKMSQAWYDKQVAKKNTPMAEEVPGDPVKAKPLHTTVKESRGHKVIATFLKNREIAQKAFNKTPENQEPKKEPEEKKKITEDQYTSEYKIKQYVDPVTGENKQRKVRPHRVNFKASKMDAKPAQTTADMPKDEKWTNLK
jgi:hypothetical protein